MASMPFLAGAILWLASVDSKAAYAKEQLAGVKEMLVDVRERLIRIEQQVKDRNSLGGEK